MSDYTWQVNSLRNGSFLQAQLENTFTVITLKCLLEKVFWKANVTTHKIPARAASSQLISCQHCQAFQIWIPGFINTCSNFPGFWRHWKYKLLRHSWVYLISWQWLAIQSLYCWYHVCVKASTALRGSALPQVTMNPWCRKAGNWGLCISAGSTERALNFGLGEESRCRRAFPCTQCTGMRISRKW